MMHDALFANACFIYIMCVLQITQKLKQDTSTQPLVLTLSQTTNFRLLQTERVCRQQFQI